MMIKVLCIYNKGQIKWLLIRGQGRNWVGENKGRRGTSQFIVFRSILFRKHLSELCIWIMALAVLL